MKDDSKSIRIWTVWTVPTILSIHGLIKKKNMFTKQELFLDVNAVTIDGLARLRIVQQHTHQTLIDTHYH